MLQDKIRADMETALRARDSLKLDTLRMLIASLTMQMKAAGREFVERMADEEVTTIIRREMKKREEAVTTYMAAGRKEQAEKEAKEYKILQEYLPPQMSREDILAIALKKKEDLGITDKKDAGILTGRVMKEVAGKADGKAVKEVVDSLFA